MPVREALPELANQGFIDLLDHVYATGESFIGMELPAQIDQNGDGRVETRFFNFVYQPTLDGHGVVDGILVQLPLPSHLDSVALLHEIAPHKDADGLHPLNLGHLVRDEAGLRSCTPFGVMRLLAEYNIPIAGRSAVVVGRSILVGKPLALMLLSADATVTIAHSRTPDLAAVCQQADILVAAVGRSQMITADMVKPGAVVIDVGINRIEQADGKSKLVGDVDFAAVLPVASYLTPVPGGVGAMTVTMLLENTVWSWEQLVQ